MQLPKPIKKAMIYEDSRLYACLATYPIVRGHTIVAWKKPAADLHLLPRKDYEYLMDKVDEVRNAMLAALRIRKVYLMYMDEANQVHWHLLPRYNIKGYNLLKHKPSRIKDLSLAKEIRKNLLLRIG